MLAKMSEFHSLVNDRIDSHDAQLATHSNDIATMEINLGCTMD